MIIKSKNVTTGGVVINPKQQHGAPIKVVAGVDAGSTETRVCIIDSTDAGYLLNDMVEEACNSLSSVYSIPSTLAVVADEREILPVSVMIQDNMDSRIVRTRTKAEQPFLNNDRVIRGTKIPNAGNVVSLYLDSGTTKSQNRLFYLNIIDALGYALLQKFNGKIPTSVDVSLVLSVRPKEQASYHVNIMRSNLVGTFKFIWGDVDIEIKISSLDFTTEPEAQISGTQTMCQLLAETSNDGDIRETSTKLCECLDGVNTYIHIEGGGSSIGIEVVNQGVLIDTCSVTFPIGGNYLMRAVRDRIRATTGRTPSEAATFESLETGTLVNGRNREDITETIKFCKMQVARDIFERFKHEVLDVQSDITLQDVELISLGGRLFRGGDYGVSVGDYFTNYVHELSEHTEVVRLQNNYIPQGNVLVAFSEENPFDGFEEDDNE